jgi:hypothetical protein
VNDEDKELNGSSAANALGAFSLMTAFNAYSLMAAFGAFSLTTAFNAYSTHQELGRSFAIGKGSPLTMGSTAGLMPTP